MVRRTWRLHPRHMDRARVQRGINRRRVVLALALAIVLGVVVAAAGSMLQLRQNLTVQPMHGGETAEETDSSSGDLNVLVLGSDARGGSDGEAEPGRSDVIIVAHLSEGDTRLDAVQIPRDTLLEMPPCEDTGSGEWSGGHGMINTALNQGPGCSVTAVEALTGVRIDHFVELDFEGFASIVDALGGLPVRLPEPLEDPRADLRLPAGEQTLDGPSALALVRTRHAVGDGSDISRLDHQKMVMSALADRAAEQDVLKRPDRLYPFLEAVTDASTVDPGLGSLNTLASVASRVGSVTQGQITIRTMPWEPAPNDPNRVVPAEDAHTMFDEMAADRPLTMTENAEDGPRSADEGSSSDTAAAPVTSPGDTERADARSSTVE